MPENVEIAGKKVLADSVVVDGVTYYLSRTKLTIADGATGTDVDAEHPLPVNDGTVANALALVHTDLQESIAVLQEIANNGLDGGDATTTGVTIDGGSA